MSTDLTLLSRLDYLQALADSESDVPAELRVAFETDIAQALQGSREKIDAVAAVSLHLMEQKALAEAKLATHKAEVDRLKARVARFEKGGARFAEYVLYCIEQYGVQKPRSTYKQIEGATATLAANNRPASVEIENASLVPLDYQGIEMKFLPEEYTAIRSLVNWLDLYWHERSSVELDEDAPVLHGGRALSAALRRGRLEPSKTAIGEVLKQKCGVCDGTGGIKDVVDCDTCHGTGRKLVPGARLVTDKKRLVIS